MAQNDGKPKINLPSPDSIDGELAPFLRAKDLPVEGRINLQILGHARSNKSKFGEGIILDVILDGKRFAFDVKFKRRNYPTLFSKFGGDPENWTGSVEIERGTHLGNDYVKVV
jgi:hypothetical protein